MESKRFREIKPGELFLDKREALHIKTQNVECLTPEDGIIWDDGFNALELNNSRYTKDRFKGNDLVTVVDIHKDLELLMNKVGWDC